MKIFSRHTFFASTFLSAIFVLGSRFVLAAVQCAGTIEAGVCIPTNTGLSDRPVTIILQTFMFWLLSIFGFIAIIAFVVAGIQYLTSAGDPKMAEKGKSNMINAIIGIIIALSGLIIIKAVSALFTASNVAF